MRRGNLFWGAVLVLLGLLLFIDNIGILEIQVWRIFWPLLLIVVGVWFLIGYLRGPQTLPVETVDFPRENAETADIKLSHGAGRFTIKDGSQPESLLYGSFSGGVKHSLRRDQNAVQLSLNVKDPSVFWWGPWNWGSGVGLNWDLNLNPDVACNLEIKAGAGELIADLTGLKVKELRLDTGASSSIVDLPENAGLTNVKISAGAASVKLNVPMNVAARIKVSGGLMGATIDRERFPKVGDVYVSDNFESAENKVDVKVDMGAGSVTIH